MPERAGLAADLATLAAEARAADIPDVAAALAAAAARLPPALGAGAAHELRNPLTAIRSAVGILAEDDLSPTDRRRFAAIARDEAIRFARLLP